MLFRSGVQQLGILVSKQQLSLENAQTFAIWKSKCRLAQVRFSMVLEEKGGKPSNLLKATFVHKANPGKDISAEILPKTKMDDIRLQSVMISRYFKKFPLEIDPTDFEYSPEQWVWLASAIVLRAHSNSTSYPNLVTCSSRLLGASILRMATSKKPFRIVLTEGGPAFAFSGSNQVTLVNNLMSDWLSNTLSTY